VADTIPPYSEIEYLVADRIATITLNRPDRLNAFTQVMRDELIDAFDRADSDDDVRAVVVTGRGRAFCAGADLSAGGDTFNADRRQRSGATGKTIDGVPRDGGGQVSLRIAASLKPVIAAINGPAVGVGVTMTLSMDIRLAAAPPDRFSSQPARRHTLWTMVPRSCLTTGGQHDRPGHGLSRPGRPPVAQ
jgi:enoyl-CoA hydratase/carnithine racemase